VWDVNEFCGIRTFVAPKNMFWTPDIGIVERYENDFYQNLLPRLFLPFSDRYCNTGYKMIDRKRVMV